MVKFNILNTNSFLNKLRKMDKYNYITEENVHESIKEIFDKGLNPIYDFEDCGINFLAMKKKEDCFRTETLDYSMTLGDYNFPDISGVDQFKTDIKTLSNILGDIGSYEIIIYWC